METEFSLRLAPGQQKETKKWRMWIVKNTVTATQWTRKFKKVQGKKLSE